jgi:peptide/nickel transport system permease protein
LSEHSNIIQKLFKNIPALFGMFFIVLCFVISIFCHPLASDNTIDANNQVLELSNKKPGFTAQMIKLKLRASSQSSLKSFFFGSESIHEYIPIRGYQVQGDLVKVIKYDGFEDTYPILSLTSDPSKGLDDVIVTKTFWLGTDVFGRDILSRVLVGTRISLSIGFLAVLISIVIGVTLGAIGGYFGGKIDDVIMLLINTTWSIPTLLLVFAIILVLDRGFYQIFLAVGLTMWVDVARIVRGQVIQIKVHSYIEAAKSFGYSDIRTIIFHILPNIIGPLLVIASANFAAAILIEAGLSYLGFGVKPPTPSWGNILEENYGKLAFGTNPIIALVPALSIMFLVLSFNLVGNALRDAFDVKIAQD